MAIDRVATYALALPDDDTFTQTEADEIVRDFLCAVCYEELSIYFIQGHYRVMVACPEHGNVTVCGRVTRNTVSIYFERALRLFPSVVKNLPDLWGELLPKKQSREKIIKDLGF